MKQNKECQRETYCSRLRCGHVHLDGGDAHGKEAAARGLSYQIYAIPEQNLREELQNYPGEIAVVLLGPQVRFKLAENKKLTDGEQIPIAVIDSLAYGTLNGAKVLDQALALIN